MPLPCIADSFELNVGKRATTDEPRIEMWTVGYRRRDDSSHCCTFDKRGRMIDTACKTSRDVRNKVVICRVGFVLGGCGRRVLLCGERGYRTCIIRDVADQFDRVRLRRRFWREFVISGERQYFQKSG